MGDINNVKGNNNEKIKYEKGKTNKEEGKHTENGT
jgi:hypothetical protein